MRENPWRSPLAIAAAFAFAAAALHMATSGGYGYFRDELYFLACGEHVDFGYVDHAPLIGWLAAFVRTVLGTSLFALRLLPALASGALVFLTGLITREMGGGRFAVALACLAVLCAPVNLVMGTMFTMNVFEPLFWAGCVYAFVRAVRRDQPKTLVLAGVVAGIGLENKHSMVFFLAALCAGLLLTPARRFFRDRWIWIAGAIAFALFLPNLIWQIAHHFPTLEDLSNVRKLHKNVELPPGPFLGEQILMMLPTNLLVWLAGLGYLLFDRDGRPFRALGWAFVVILAMMMAMHGKDYYMAPAYPMLFAAGGLAWEKWSRLRFRWVRFAIPVLILALAIPLSPAVLPVLAPDALVRYLDRIGLKPPPAETTHHSALPQHFSDRFGWREMVEKVAEAYNRLSPAERPKAAILAGNYGEAGAVDLMGSRYGLPKAISGHQTYYYWGPRDYTGDVVIVLGWSRASVEKMCTSVEEGPRVGHPLAMSYEQFTIWTCRGAKTPLRELWPRLKFWN